MKLLRYTSRIYLIYLLIIFLVMSGLIYFIINLIVNEELDERMELTREMLIGQIKNGKEVTSVSPYWEVVEVDEKPADANLSKDTVMDISHEDRMEVFRQKVYYRVIDDIGYRLLVRTPKTGADYLILMIGLPAILIILILLASLAIINLRISKRIWSPFNFNLSALSSFSIADDKAINFQKSEIDEFEQLSAELLDLTNKLRHDYQNLKRFTQNASHEIQTPLSIIITRLEHLMNNDTLSSDLAKEVGVIFSSAKRLTKLNKTLLLLSKIENRQNDHREKVDMTTLLQQQLDFYKELIEIKSLRMKLDIASNVVLTTNPDLSTVLLANLMSNAIRHNHQGGEIEIGLSSKSFRIRNSGQATTEDPVRLFGRFVKGDPSSPSSGLGLALVKEIAELYGWGISYTIKDEYHLLEVNFHQTII